VLVVLAGWQSAVPIAAIVSLLMLVAALFAGQSESGRAAANVLLIRAIVVSGAVVAACAIYLLVVLGFGRLPQDSEHDVVGLMVAATLVFGVVAVPLISLLGRVARSRVYGAQRSTDQALRAFGEQVSRSAASEDLLLQVCESLTETLDLRSAEIWTGRDGSLARNVALPERPPAELVVAEDAREVVTRAQAQGEAWARVWLPSIAQEHDGRILRIVPIAYAGELMGLLVLERQESAGPFTVSEDVTLVALARQLGMALNNVRLDSALQDSLRELQVRNAELAASRIRIVAAGDESRRRIERNLHDGAQQNLVALAVKVGLINRLLDTDPGVARDLLEELPADIQTALTVLRELAHGIYPPLLRERGLPEALSATAGRASLPTIVDADGLGRFEPDVEAAVYFCCVEALQNSCKYAGHDAKVSLTVSQADGDLTFEVLDDGVGFDSSGVVEGSGFVNMRDRLGAFGGVISITSAPGAGTSVRGSLPVSAARGESTPPS
jgi:signal transduction histidine kinase